MLTRSQTNPSTSRHNIENNTVRLRHDIDMYPVTILHSLLCSISRRERCQCV